MGKIAFDKYYTSPYTARWCINKTYEIIGKENITEIIESSAGCGSFSKQIPDCKAYDLYPQSEQIIQQDFLKLDLGDYKKGRLFIGNPPFGGSTGQLIKQFYDKCIEDGDYIAWILPIGFYNNYSRFNKSEIIYQCKLVTKYSNRDISTAFIIYKKSDIIKTEPKLKSIIFERYPRTNLHENKKINNYDYSFSSWGSSSSILREMKPYEKASVLTMTIDEKWKNEVISFMKWLYYYNKDTNILNQFSMNAENIIIWRLVQLIKIAIPEIE